MIDSQYISFQPSTWTMAFGVLLVLAVMAVSWMTLVRAKFSSGMVLLEIFRILLATMIAFMINQPEWLEKFIPQEEPVIAVLWDDSGSMATRDVSDEGAIAGDAESRAEFVKRLIDSELWKTVGGDVRIEFEPFSSNLENPALASDLNAALDGCLANYENLRGVVMVTDGDWNVGASPENAAKQFRFNNIPVFTMAIGSRNRLPDIEVTSVDAPTFGIVNKTTRIPFVITNSMSRAVDQIVTLRSSAGDEITRTVHIDPKSKIEDAITWKPKREGEYELTFSIPAAEDELMKDNNSRTVPIKIKKESLKVLVIESYPRWEYRYLRNALSRDPGVEVSCLLFHPDLKKVGGGADYIEEFPNDQELSKFDVVFLGDVGIGEDQLTVDDCARIRQLVTSQASGLIFMPGFRSRQFSLLSTPLGELMPVLLDEAQPRGWGSRTPAQFQLTQRGRESLLTKLADSPEASEQVWRGLPGFQWFAPVLRAKAGCDVLAVHSTESNINGRLPLLVTRTFGAGKILFMGTDGAWRWREGVEDKYHYRFWGQVARWMAYQRNMASGNSMRMFFSPDRPTSGNLLTLNANVMASSGEPLQDGNVFVQVISPSGNSERIRLVTRDEEENWGLFSGGFTPDENGKYKLVMTCRENGATLETEIDVQGAERERLGQPARYDVLGDIASVSRGKMVESDELPDLISALSEIPEPEPQDRRLRLWCHWIWATIFLSMLGFFWIGRKLVGVI